MQVLIEAPRFCAMYDMDSGRIAPIIQYMKGWTLQQIEDHCKAKQWKLTVIPDKPEMVYDYTC